MWKGWIEYKATHRFFYRHSAAYSDVVDFNLGERFVRLATRAACILQVADEPLVEAVLVDLACAVGVAFVALKRDEWDDFSFSLRRLWRLCRGGAGKCVGSSSGAVCSGIRAAVNDGSFALIFLGVVTGGSTAASWRQMQHVLTSWSSSSSVAAFRLLLFSAGS